MKLTGILLLLLVWQSGFSQWVDDFSDGNFNINPSWSGSTTDFMVENNALRLFAPAISGQSYLSTPSDNISSASWRFSIRLDFNPSASNYTKIYLVSDKPALDTDLNGYFIKVGGSSDEVSLYRQDGIAEIEIIDGLNGRLSLSVVELDVLVTRSEMGEWQVSSKLIADPDWQLEGTVLDKNYVSSSYFGVSAIYTSTRSEKFYFDNFQIAGTAYIDTDLPILENVSAQVQNQISIAFSEAILNETATSLNNYLLNNSTNPEVVTVSDSSVLLTFSEPLFVVNELAISGVTDLSGNQLKDTTIQVIYVDPSPPQYGDLVINELMVDPSPREDLPEVEYIELYNSSTKAINMTEWSLSDKSTVTILNEYILLPDSFLIFTSSSALTEMEAYGDVLSLAPWPSLNNTGDSLTLISATGIVIDQVTYDKSWYSDNEKESGGWSLEKMNPTHPCSGYLNWQASLNLSGGTPGRQNSAFLANDTKGPELTEFFYSERELSILFDEPIGNTSPGIRVEPSLKVVSLVVDYNRLHIVFDKSFAQEQLNVVELQNIEDCFGNVTEAIAIDFVPDFSPPKIDTVYSNYPDIIEVYFNEPVKKLKPEQILINGYGPPIVISPGLHDASHFSLSISNALIPGSEYLVFADSIEDLNTNMTVRSQYTLVYRPLSYPSFGEVLITEIMADPSPAVNLPESEFIELFNTTDKRLLLKNLFIADAKDIITIPTGIIEPLERVVLTKTAAADEFLIFGKVIGIPNWPTLNNSGDEVVLTHPDSSTIHSVSYSSDWYSDSEKADGGWSLELIDERNFCGGAKVWRASVNNSGGTPGLANSQQAVIEDLLPPTILSAYALSSDSIEIRFSESLDNQLPNISLEFQPVYDVKFANVDRDKLSVRTSTLEPRVRYLLKVRKMSDCIGNSNEEEQLELLLPEEAAPGEVIMSEVLFNPVRDGADFVEIYNNSAKNISLTNWQLSNGSSLVYILPGELLEPYSYRVFSKSPSNITDTYPKAIISNIYELAIPTMPNVSGSIALRNSTNTLIDSIQYSENWHFPYLTSVEGVSLERLDYLNEGYLAKNWASAASLENYATPGYKNSQSISSQGTGSISVSPRVIVPNGNGRDDFSTITINNVTSGALATVTVYNLQGQPVKQLANNSLLGTSDIFTWDGTNSTGTIVPLGHYIILVETISNTGNTKTFREKIVVANNF